VAHPAAAVIDESPAGESGTNCTAQRLRRVLHIINGEDYAGAERVQDLLAANLPQYGYQVDFVCIKRGLFAERRHCRSAGLLEMPAATPFGLAVSWRLAQRVRCQDYSLVHAHTPRSAIVAHWVARWTSRPFVYHVHSPASRDSTRPLQNWLNCRAERYFLSSAARLITVSGSLALHMAQLGYDERRIHVVPNGVNSGAEPPERRRSGNAWTLGMVALFRPRKGVEVLLQGLRRMVDAGVDVRLRAIGGFQSSAYETEVHTLTARLGLSERVEWTGFCSDVRAELARLDVLVLPSLFGEGLPMVVLEAMAAGVPVVASRVEGVPEAVRDGVDGLLVPPGDPTALAARLTSLICGSVDCESLRRSARQRQVARFSDTSMARNVARIYDGLLT
jgi:glycosyltransferase involved in cell wall biosynthesis